MFFAVVVLPKRGAPVIKFAVVGGGLFVRGESKSQVGWWVQSNEHGHRRLNKALRCLVTRDAMEPTI